MNYAELLAGHGRVADDALRDAYNTSVRRTWESVRDFVGVHYRCADGDGPFWAAMADVDLGPRVERVFETFDRYGYDWSVETADTGSFAELRVFSLPDFYTVMRSLGVESAFYEDHEFAVGNDVRRRRDAFHKDVREDVDANHMTTEEIYRGVFEFDGIAR